MDANVAALNEKELLVRINTDLLKTHKGIGEEVTLKRDLRSTEREKRHCQGIEAESRLLNTAQQQLELMRAEHAQ